MHVITPGITYDLDHLEGPGTERLHFIRKKTVDGYLVTVQNGTTTEAVLAALIDRTKTLLQEFYSVERDQALLKMQEALMWFNARQRDRQARGVQGQHKL